jgi:hypothetical protein
MDVFISTIGFLLIVFMLINIGVTWKLFQFARNSGWIYPALNERAFSAGIKTIGSLILGVLGFNRLHDLGIPSEGALVVLLIAILLHGFPPVIWLWYYSTGRFSRVIEDLSLEPSRKSKEKVS